MGSGSATSHAVTTPPPPAVVWLVRDPGVPEPGITAACPTEEAARHFVAALERQRRKLFVERWEVDAVSKLSAALGKPAEDHADGHTGWMVTSRRW